MFKTPGPRMFGLPCGADFATELVAGLRARLGDAPPEALARVEIFVNSDRMARRLREVFDAGPASLLPRIRLVTDLADPLTKAALPTPVPPLRRRLELTGLVSKLLDSAPDLAPRAALFDLADSLATLMEEMQGEGVPPEVIENLDVSDQSGHWQRALTFLRIVQQYFEADSAPDPQAYARRALQLRLAAWEIAPPSHPILVAGSTGSRGTTAAFMEAVARLPQGAVILPGFDADTPDHVWHSLDNALTGEDHPQFRFARMMQGLELSPGDVRNWTETPPPSAARNRVLSLALRPAPVTHQWLSEGPSLPMLPDAMSDVTLLEAPSQRDEALAIALRLRQAVKDGQRAAVITPDRMLTRRVTSALDRWNILPDDSGGTPAQLTPPGRLLRHVSELFVKPLSAEMLLTLLKHPLSHTGADRGPHLLNTRELELYIRKTGMPYPQPEPLAQWGQTRAQGDWAAWVGARFCGQEIAVKRPLAEWVDHLLHLTETICAGPGIDGSGDLWKEAAGRKLRGVMQGLAREAHHGAEMSARDFADLLSALLSREEVRDRDAPHPDILIWGTLEARVMDADLVILAGLNEGAWPELPGADPWLNRAMRAKAGLLLPERRIGLSAHDFQQAAAAPEVWFSRSMKSDDAETVPSRWLNRLMNLMRGLESRDGSEAIKQMQARGNRWLALARASETPIEADPATRPSPAPPAESRPRKLSVTEIKRLVRDPFAIYAKHVLKLRALDPLMQAPDALMRGILTHKVLEDFVKATQAEPLDLTPEVLKAQARAIIGDPEQVPFPTVRALWQARMDRIAQWFVETEIERQGQATPSQYEIRGERGIPALGFVLTATADRIDIDRRGGAHIYDYKTGAAPSTKEQGSFDKQLLLEAAMLDEGGFPPLDPPHVERAVFISLQPSNPKEVLAPLEETPPEQVWEEFTALIAAYHAPETGFTARRALQKDNDAGDFDHLARFGEWDVTDAPVKEVLK
ncbi:double-strand break repair protein AddB [Mameliella alba]|nr:double-strand break repair protein AddB [Antarctobacter heliothermus]MBY6142690.1 double-strand break repair protein AddB [Mameliella alba]MCA0953585.1 double-strand break repair protein AddB [Mameliella alba]